MPLTPEQRARMSARWNAKPRGEAPQTDPEVVQVETAVDEALPPVQDVGEEIETESVVTTPDPISLKQNREAVAQGLLPQSPPDRMFRSAGQVGRQQLLQDIEKGAGFVGEGVDAAKEFYNNLGRDKVAELPSQYVDRQIEMLEAEKMRLQQNIDDLRGEAARRTGVQEDKLRFQGMEP